MTLELGSSLRSRGALWLFALSALFSACGDDGTLAPLPAASLDAMEPRADADAGSPDGDVPLTPEERFQRGVVVTEAPAIPDRLVPVFEDLPDVTARPDEIELTGNLYFNDLRNHGRFELRHGPEGEVGAEVEGERDDWANLLGALDAVVDVYEIDGETSGDCQRAEHLGSSSVGPDGEFRVIVSGEDPCGDGPPGESAIAVAFRLKSCHDWHCYAAVDDDIVIYRLWDETATPSAPRSLSQGTHALGEFIFAVNTESGPLFRGDYDQAASVFAAAVDIARWAHREGGIDAQPRTFPMLKVRFPSTGAPNARASGSSLIHILKPSRHFQNNGLFHEYGHIIGFRAFRGSSGRCSTCDGGQYERNGNSSWNPTSLEYPYAALKEGWANFISKAIGGGCTGRFDDNERTAVLGRNDDGSPAPPPRNGDGVPRNVTRFFCDWLDDEPDDDPAIPGMGDVLHAEGVSELYDRLRDMWTNIADRDALDVCSVIRWYIDPTPTPPADDAERDTRLGEMRATAYQNGLQCELPPIE